MSNRSQIRFRGCKSLRLALCVAAEPLTAQTGSFLKTLHLVVRKARLHLCVRFGDLREVTELALWLFDPGAELLFRHLASPYGLT